MGRWSVAPALGVRWGPEALKKSYWARRKNTVPTGGLTKMNLLVPSSEGVVVMAPQFVSLRLLLVCRVKPVVEEGQETMAWLPERVIVSNGAPGVCTTEIILQKPPVTE